MAKEFRGGKYVPVEKSKRRRGSKEEPLDVEIYSFTQKGKVYYSLKYVGQDNPPKSMPKWRQTYSPRKYAKKHHFNII